MATPRLPHPQRQITMVVLELVTAGLAAALVVSLVALLIGGQP